jgi:hypothetical protein
MMETVSTSEAPANVYQTTRRTIPEDCHLQFLVYLTTYELYRLSSVEQHK